MPAASRFGKQLKNNADFTNKIKACENEASEILAIFTSLSVTLKL